MLQIENMTLYCWGIQYVVDNVTTNYLQVIKNINNVSGCRDTRTAKSKETRGMIEHNSEVYNHPYRDLLPYIHVQ